MRLQPVIEERGEFPIEPDSESVSPNVSLVSKEGSAKHSPNSSPNGKPSLLNKQEIKSKSFTLQQPDNMIEFEKDFKTRRLSAPTVLTPSPEVNGLKMKSSDKGDDTLLPYSSSGSNYKLQVPILDKKKVFEKGVNKEDTLSQSRFSQSSTNSHRSLSHNSENLSGSHNNLIPSGRKSSVLQSTPRSVISVEGHQHVDDVSDSDEYYDGEDDSETDDENNYQSDQGDSDYSHSIPTTPHRGEGIPVPEYMGRVQEGLSIGMINTNRSNANGSLDSARSSFSRPRRLTDYLFPSSLNRSRRSSQSNNASSANNRGSRVNSFSSFFSGKSKDRTSSSPELPASATRESNVSHSSVGSGFENGAALAPVYSVNRPWTRRHDGGINGHQDGARGDEIYYVGVIDILQQYNISKRVETFIKSLQYDSSQISAVNAKFYAKRFVQFIRDHSD